MANSTPAPAPAPVVSMYEFAIMYAPKDKPEAAKVVVPTQIVIATDDKQAAIQAARAIPGEFEHDLASIHVVVRLFTLPAVAVTETFP